MEHSPWLSGSIVFFQIISFQNNFHVVGGRGRFIKCYLVLRSTAVAKELHASLGGRVAKWLSWGILAGGWSIFPSTVPSCAPLHSLTLSEPSRAMVRQLLGRKGAGKCHFLAALDDTQQRKCKAQVWEFGWLAVKNKRGFLFVAYFHS